MLLAPVVMLATACGGSEGSTPVITPAPVVTPRPVITSSPTAYSLVVRTVNTQGQPTVGVRSIWTAASTAWARRQAPTEALGSALDRRLQMSLWAPTLRAIHGRDGSFKSQGLATKPSSWH